MSAERANRVVYIETTNVKSRRELHDTFARYGNLYVF